MNKIMNRGFTLIELLVVIAIIGILASVVLASLNTARDKGTDAANKSNLNNVRAAAELLYDEADNYDGVCDLDQISASGASCFEAADNSSWAASVEMIGTTATTFYCVDSTGFGGDLTSDPALSASDTTCS